MNVKRTFFTVIILCTLFLVSCDSMFGPFDKKGICVVTFDANGGSGTMTSQEITAGATATLKANAFTRSGYPFAGWGLSSTTVSVAYADGASYTIGTSNVSLYALWGYTVTFDANGGSGAMPAQVSASGESLALPVNSFTKKGYTFAGWAENSTATAATYANGANYTMGASDVTLYAVWKLFVSYTNTLSMIAVDGGTFYNGTANMTVSNFYIGKYEITQGQYKTIMGSNPVPSSSSYGYGGDYPVYEVSWYEAVAFCNALSEKEGYDDVYTINGTTVTADFTKNGYRLPTETEWEFAARGGNSSRGYTYSGSNTIGDVAWYSGNADGAHTVGQKTPNELEIYDMSGNVWEWCWDWYGDYPNTAQTDYKGPSSGLYRVFRGGSWFSDGGAAVCAVSLRGNGASSSSRLQQSRLPCRPFCTVIRAGGYIYDPEFCIWATTYCCGSVKIVYCSVFGHSVSRLLV